LEAYDRRVVLFFGDEVGQHLLNHMTVTLTYKLRSEIGL
jgi:hypothetical protein